MTKLGLFIVLALAVGGCSRGDSLEIPTGSEVTVEKKDGVTVKGTLLEVGAEQVVLENVRGERTTVRRADIQTIASTAPRTAAPADGTPPAATTGTVAAAADTDDKKSANPLKRILTRAPEYREVSIPTGTVLSVELQTALGSDTSSPEDPVRGTLRNAVTIDDVRVLPVGTALFGHVTDATRSAKVKGRGSVAFRFSQIDLPGDGGRTPIATGTITTVAPATKKEDAAKIGGGAAGGAIIGGIIGGGDGAAKGAAIGGAAGTGVVLATRGKEVRLGAGLPVSVRLTAPLTVRIAMK
jgi:hypothetical protein